MSVKGFKNKNGEIQGLDYSALDNVPSEVICNPQVVLASGTIEANGSAVGDIDTGITLGDLRQYKKFGIVFIGKSNTALSNVYLSLRKEVQKGNVNACVLSRSTSASFVSIFEHLEGTKYLTSVCCVDGNPSITRKEFLTGFIANTTDNNGLSNVLLSSDTNTSNIFRIGTGVIKDMDSFPDTYKLCISSLSTPSINYDWAIIGVSKVENF